ncbi:hypothetical protein [Aeromicrobium sp. 179-A 4D2 NHS]|uniref:hypothetical protein n=1 Tax=Aeromicrobium sp. 179-A 4D2 NHS TaxID=3142375 RepID=UPI0039A07E11
MKKFLLALATVMLAAAALVLPLSPANAAANDLVIANHYSSPRNIEVCRDWGNTSCQTASPKGFLTPGQNSKTKFGWADADGFKVPAGCRFHYTQSGTKKSVSGGSTGKWFKMGGFFGTKHYITSNNLTC